MFLRQSLQRVSSSTKCPNHLIQCRYAHVHRTIQVQLTADIPGLGVYGSLQKVSPGRMRNKLYPHKLANYIPRGAAPQLLSPPNDPANQSVDFEGLAARLRSLPPLVFRARVHRSPSWRDPISASSDGSVSTTQPTSQPVTSGQAIYGSVTLAEITSRINAECGSPLVPPDAIVSLASRGAEKRTKLKALGTYGVEVLLRTGDVVDVEVRVEPKTE